MDSYSLSRKFWDFAFENTGKIKPTHVAIYFFAVEHCNRLGWKTNFGLPTTMVLEAITVKSYSVYKTAFDDLVDFGFFEVIQYSKNQYSSNIIALKENSKANNKANSKALDKALVKHIPKHCSSIVQSTDQSIVSIDKQVTIEQINKDVAKENLPFSDYDLCIEFWLKEFKQGWIFGGQQGKALKSIIKKLKTITADNINKISIPETFKLICNRLPDWYKDKDLPVIDSKLNEIITEIKKLQNGTITYKDSNGKPISKYHN